MPGEFSTKRHLLFDLDGTLVDSTALHAGAFVATLQARHSALAAAFDYTPQQGRPTADVFRSLGLSDPGEVAALTERKQQLYREAVAAGRVPVFPGVPALLQGLHAAGRRLFLVTGASRRSAERVLAATGLERWFAGLTTADDVAAGKPAPEPYLHTLTQHRLGAADSLAIEDAANGIASARAAGLDAVLVNTDLQLPGIRNVGPVARLATLLS